MPTRRNTLIHPTAFSFQIFFLHLYGDDDYLIVSRYPVTGKIFILRSNSIVFYVIRFDHLRLLIRVSDLIVPGYD